MSQTVLITGASSGFGLHSAKLFAREGWNVVATMRDVRAGEELTDVGNVLVTRLDVQEAASIHEAIAAGIERFGGIDVLVNNAGFSLYGVFESLTPEKIREQFDVNLFGVMDVTRAILPHFRTRKRGTLINISSGAGVFGLPMISAYNASKFALEGFSESLSYELLSQNILVKLVEPGGVLDTKFSARLAAEASQVDTPEDYAGFVAAAERVFDGLRANRLASSEDVARVILQAANDRSDRLRYVATEDIQPLVRARRETSEEAYMALMRERLMPMSVRRSG
ncbi:MULTISPECIES: SDR family oxidoreductase [Pseudomonas]|uniref:SDR family oxidoreductase n=1 Tax=Pseudomonadaceae TaxID=135621 RepID=UPI000402FCD7|nr:MULTISPECIES: SDR family oxidoreductase [Pseudomonas]MDE3739876.1 SDR family oxidoreductase [Pseudomonas resinovorans]